ncbi:hypothetical protein TGAMA5MH_03278 [Trichoderma gamsii]|uniref:O-methyltransferase C-terminal domain-containing protein n=1 Tax=Trichoderma gamsii TaxID=398673 RepID=A0A2K0TH63_9HYPO|nr:hypothetical protein TGAMA5MH_03278 [Trichoderma gamsii]
MAKLSIPSNERNGSATAAGQRTTSAAASQEPRMGVLAEIIRVETEKLETYLKEHGITQPSFHVDAPLDFPHLPDEIQESRQKIVFATNELANLVRGPRESVRFSAWSYLDSLSLQLINSYQLAKLVPLDAPISLKELQSKTTLEPIFLARTLRYAMTNYMFYEPSPGYIAHTANSRVLAQDSSLQAWVGFNSDSCFPAAAKVPDALKGHPEAVEPTHAGFNYAFDTVGKEPMYATLAKKPIESDRFARAMVSFTHGEGYEVSHLVDNYDFSDVDARGGTFVDIGGSHGFVSEALAKKWKNVNFIVQDRQEMVDSAPKPVSEDPTVAERLSFQVHDFFKEQPVKGADVYYFRWILHNYSTPYAVKILKSLIPALKPGSRIVINDYCIREPGSETLWDDKLLRSLDMIMGVLFNSQERDEQEFRDLFKAADPRFHFKGVLRVENCKMSVIEAVWDE